MKARKVFEELEFKRGIDSKKSLGLGVDRKIPPIELLDQSDGYYLIYRSSEYSHIIVRMITTSKVKIFDIPTAWSTSLKNAKKDLIQFNKVQWTTENIAKEFLDDPEVKWIKRIKRI